MPHSSPCNRLHAIEERLARGLLMIQDRVGDEELELTPELLASMLGSRRAGVTVAAGTLRKADLIEYTRGQIVICDREGLDDVACECCDILREQLESALCRR